MGGSQNVIFGQATTPPSITHTVTYTQTVDIGTYNSHGVSWNVNNASLYYNGQNGAFEGVYGTLGHTLQYGNSMENIILLGTYGAVTAHQNNTIWSMIIMFSNQLTADQHKLIFNLANRTINSNISTPKNI
jgi:hypothetical protein